jgi:hypothetical protein
MVPPAALHIGVQFVQLQPRRADANHHAIVQRGAALADAKGECADRATVDAHKSGNGALAEAINESGDNLNLFFAGKDVHGLDPCVWIGPKPDSGKTA